MKHRLNNRYGQVIGLTGNLCTGKSLALAILRNMGFLTFSMDKFVHHIMKNNSSVKAQIIQKFQNSFVDNIICRDILGDLVFNNQTNMTKLEAIITPYTKEKILEIVNRVRSTKERSVVLEVPLLFEKKREKYFDIIIYLYSSYEEILKRALKRTNMTTEKIFTILSSQFSPKDVHHKVSYLIYNCNKRYLIKALKNISEYGTFKGNRSRY